MLAHVKSAGLVCKDLGILLSSLLLAYVIVIGPPLAVAHFIGGTPLFVWSIVCSSEFMLGFAVILFGAVFEVRPRFHVGSILILLSVANFFTLPIYILMGS